MSQNIPDELEKIGQLIASLPSKDLLQRCQTEAQRNEWQNYKKNQLLLAEAWKAEFILGQGDPIHDALTKQEISKHRHDMLQAKVLLYKQQWELIKAANQYVEQWHNTIYELLSKVAKKLLPRRFPSRPPLSSPNPSYPPLTPPSEGGGQRNKFLIKSNQSVSGGVGKYPFDSAFDLFAEIIREEVNGTFSWCLEPYYEVPVKKWREATKWLIKNSFEKVQADGTYPELKPPEVTKLKNKLVWNKLGFSWLGVTLLVCQFVAMRDRTLAKKLIAYNWQLAEYAKVGVTASGKVGGFAWKKGKIMPASKAGGIYHKSD
jgi:hypothetical protein